MGALKWGKPTPKKIPRGVTQEGLANPASDGVARPFCRRPGVGRSAELRKCPSPATPSPPVALGLPILLGGGCWDPSSHGSFPPLNALFGRRTPQSCPAAPPEAGAPGPLPPEPARLECSLLLAGPLPVRHVGSRFLSPTPAH